MFTLQCFPRKAVSCGPPAVHILHPQVRAVEQECISLSLSMAFNRFQSTAPTIVQRSWEYHLTNTPQAHGVSRGFINLNAVLCIDSVFLRKKVFCEMSTLNNGQSWCYYTETHSAKTSTIKGFVFRNIITGYFQCHVQCKAHAWHAIDNNRQ